MYESTAILKGRARFSYDEYGNELVTYTERVVFVQPLSVYSSEFYQAAQAGLHPSITLEIANRLDYKGEKLINFQGQDYEIIRVDWNGQKDKIRLICEERIGLEEESE